MKKLVVFFVVLSMVAGASFALAKTMLIPKGEKVSATVFADGTAKITPPAGWHVEFYAYEGIKDFSAGTATVDLREGRRFQTVSPDGVYALLTPEMRNHLPDFFGDGVDLDCSNPNGCTFIITGK